MDLVSSKREISYDEIIQVPSTSNELQSTELVQCINVATVYSNLHVMRICVCVFVVSFNQNSNINQLALPGLLINGGMC
jgi:hypothetical protein